MQSPAPSEYFPGIKFNYSFYTTGETKVTLEYCNNNYSRCTGYAYPRSIATTFNGILFCLGGINTTNITATGTITSNLFNGSGAGLSNLNSSNISGGTLGVNIGGTGFSGSGGQLTNLNASYISDGTLDVTRGGTGANNFTGGRILLGNGTNAITENGNLTWTTATNTLSSTNFSGDGSRLTAINASNVPSGVLSLALGGTGLTTFTANRILIGGTITLSQSAGLVWNPSTFTLTSTNIAGAGSAITDLNVSNVSFGTLSKTYDGSKWNAFGALGKIKYLGGNVGIGVTDPIYNLDISGNLYTSGTMVTDGGLAVQTGNVSIDTYVGVGIKL
jgi:hypothetical protein